MKAATPCVLAALLLPAAVWSADINNKGAGPGPTVATPAAPGVQALQQLVDRMTALRGDGRLEASLAAGRDAVKMIDALGGGSHSWKADILAGIGSTLEKMGRTNDAAEAYRQALAISEGINGPNHRKTAQHLESLGVACRKVGCGAEAVALLRRALSIREKLDGVDRGSQAILLTELAFALEAQDQRQEALSLHARALALEEQHGGAEHSNTAIAAYNLALAYDALGRPQDALPLYIRALEIREKLDGPNHPYALIYATQLADVYERLKRPSDALPLALRVAAQSDAAAAPTTVDAARWILLGVTYLDLNRPAEAVPAFQSALRVYEQLERPPGLTSAAISAHLGISLRRSDQPSQAVPLLERALSILEMQASPDPAKVRGMMEELVVAYKSAGMPSKAIALIQRAVSSPMYAGDPNLNGGIWLLLELVDALSQNGEHDRAEEGLMLLLKQEDGRITSPDPRILQAVYKMAGAQMHSAQGERATQLLNQGLTFAERAFGARHQEARDALDQLRYAYFLGGRYAQALPLYERALLLAEQQGGPDGAASVGPTIELAVLNSYLGRLDTAQKLGERGVLAATRAADNAALRAQALTALARVARLQGRHDAAWSHLLQAQAVAEKLAEKQPGICALVLQGLGETALARGEIEASAPYLTQALSMGRQAWEPGEAMTGRILASRAAQYVAIGQVDLAVPLLEQALSIADSWSDREGVWRVALDMSRARWRQGDQQAAGFFASKVVNTIQAMRADIGLASPESQREFMLDKRVAYRELAAQLESAGRPRRAQQVLQRLDQEMNVSQLP